jgi:hypothetical protein
MVSRPQGEKSERRIEPVFLAGRKRARFRCHCPEPPILDTLMGVRIEYLSTGETDEWTIRSGLDS